LRLVLRRKLYKDSTVAREEEKSVILFYFFCFLRRTGSWTREEGSHGEEPGWGAVGQGGVGMSRDMGKASSREVEPNPRLSQGARRQGRPRGQSSGGERGGQGAPGRRATQNEDASDLGTADVIRRWSKDKGNRHGGSSGRGRRSSLVDQTLSGHPRGTKAHGQCVSGEGEMCLCT